MKLTQSITLPVLLSISLTIGCQPHGTKTASQKLGLIDAVVKEEIEKGSFPGAVVLVGRAEKIVYWQAFGNKVTEPCPPKADMTLDSPPQADSTLSSPSGWSPCPEAVTKNTIFDLASLTKPIATATSVMILVDRKQIKLTDYVGTYLPAFACNGKEEVRIEHLLTHTSGLPPYANANELKEQFGSPCPDKVIEKICSMKALSKPGAEFNYSCLGYIILAKIVEVAAGQTVADVAAENVFEPLKMTHTTFNPPESWMNDIAPTQFVDGQLLSGTVHDPLARLMGGISGNAGLFSTAYDLSIYCRMLLNGGRVNRIRVLSPEAVTMLTTAQTHGRAYGFDVSSDYSWVKGSYASEKAFCHTGYTGTSIVCDPAKKVYLIILTNRTYPSDEGTTKAVRTKVADIVFQTYK
jgi:CubicO group peptidase (beta-lactamase class C family)